MKKLEVVSKFSQVEGKVIERYGEHTYALREYHINEYGEYDVEDLQELTLKQLHDILSKRDLASRVKRIHYYFKTADYISDNAIDLLNLNNENSFRALKGIVIN